MEESGLKVSANCGDRTQGRMLMNAGGGEVPIVFPEEILGSGTVTSINGEPGNGENIARSGSQVMGSSQIEGGYNGGAQTSGAVGEGMNRAQPGSGYVSARLSHANFSMFPSYMQAHSLMDPSIQESLSPFFQPFGVDVSHFPMTNPPIFQSSLASDSPNPRRRRISISNGQIGQLGEDEDAVDSIYYSQPPPMPPQRMQPVTSNVNTSVGQTAQVVKLEPTEQTVPLGLNNGNFAERPSYEDLQSQSRVPDNYIDPNGKPGPDIPSSAAMQKQKSDQSSVKSSSSIYSERQTLPGTAAWKKARLLERNRIAASKCRQRKKIAHEQLQKDVTILTNSNRVMKTKLEYYEKLVTKFKKFMELHMESCGGSSDGLTMIEEMLKIDHDLQQDEQGNLIEKGRN